MLIPLPAAATFNVTSPYIQEGVWTLESKNRYDEDHRASEDNYRRHKLELKYGLTQWWEVETAGSWEKNPGQNYDFTILNIETKLRLTEPGEYWVDTAIDFSYNIADNRAAADSVDAKLLLRKNMDAFQHGMNIRLGREIGDNRNGSVGVDIAWKTLYKMEGMASPGIEYYGDFGSWNDTGSYSDQKHRIGPVLAVKLHDQVNVETAALFGISRATEDVAFKFNLKFDFP